jgi:hypothetical protein
MNPYIYGTDDPLSNSDPDGNCSRPSVCGPPPGASPEQTRNWNQLASATVQPAPVLSDVQLVSSSRASWRGNEPLHDHAVLQLMGHVCPQGLFASPLWACYTELDPFKLIGHAEIQAPVDLVKMMELDGQVVSGMLYEVKAKKPGGIRDGLIQAANNIAYLEVHKPAHMGWKFGEPFAPFSFDYLGHKMHMEYFGQGVAVYYPDCDPDCADEEGNQLDLTRPSLANRLTTPVRVGSKVVGLIGVGKLLGVGSRILSRIPVGVP